MLVVTSVKLIIASLIPLTVPVNVGEAIGAFSLSNSLIAPCTSVELMLPAGVLRTCDALSCRGVVKKDAFPSHTTILAVILITAVVLTYTFIPSLSVALQEKTH